MKDIIRKRGDTYADEFKIVSDTTGSVIDITDHTFLLTVDPEEKPTDTTNNIFQITGVITEASNGLVSFTPTVAQADNLGNFFYDLQMTEPDGKIRTIESGVFEIVQDITK